MKGSSGKRQLECGGGCGRCPKAKVSDSVSDGKPSALLKRRTHTQNIGSRQQPVATGVG